MTAHLQIFYLCPLLIRCIYFYAQHIIVLPPNILYYIQTRVVPYRWEPSFLLYTTLSCLQNSEDFKMKFTFNKSSLETRAILPGILEQYSEYFIILMLEVMLFTTLTIVLRLKINKIGITQWYPNNLFFSRSVGKNHTEKGFLFHTQQGFI